MKNYKITCPSIFIAVLIYNYIELEGKKYKGVFVHIEIKVKVITFKSGLELDEIHELFAGTPFDIVIQELDNNGNLVRQRMTP